jgi:hypothetical protein
VLHRVVISMTVVGPICGYVAMLYALMQTIVLIDHAYFQKSGDLDDFIVDL